jgi:hypothetical protein
MLELLHKAIVELPELMNTTEGWNSVDVTYHDPRVERIWRQWGENRISLHRIHPCDEGKALFHPHPWPSAIHVVSGRYEMGVSSYFYPSDESEKLEEVTEGPAWTDCHAKILMVPGSEYEMRSRDGWHYVRPLDAPSDSIMVSGPIYEPRVKMPHLPITKQGPLAPKRFDELFDMWKHRVHDMADRRDPPVECGTCGWEGRHSELASYEGESPYSRCPKCWDEDQVFSKGRR